MASDFIHTTCDLQDLRAEIFEAHKADNISMVTDAMEKYSEAVIDSGDFLFHNEVDLHGMTRYGAEKLVAYCLTVTNFQRPIDFITGIGRNSAEGMPVLKMAISFLLHSYGLQYRIPPQNAGVIVYNGGQAEPAEWGRRGESWAGCVDEWRRRRIFEALLASGWGMKT